MTRFRHALTAGALVASFAMPTAAAQAQNGPSSGAPGQVQTDGGGHGPGPGMMGGGYGPGFTSGYGAGYGPGARWGGYGPGMMWGGFGAGMGWGGGFGLAWADNAATAENLADARLAFLKAEIKITPKQEALWNRYAQAVRESSKEVFDRHRAFLDRSWREKSLLQRLDEREQLMATSLDALRKTDGALKPLYAALDGDQKQLADEFMGMPMPFGPMF